MNTTNRNLQSLRVSGWAAGLGLSLVCTMGTAKAANLITNGSFEIDPVPAGSFVSYPSSGTPSLTGWTVGGVEVAAVSTTFTEGGATFPAQDGAHWLDLTGNGSNSPSNSVSQVVNGLNIGSNYTLSFYVGSAQGSFFFPSTVTVSIGGGPLSSFTNPSATTTLEWQQYSLDFTATSTNESIAFFNGSSAFNNLSGLDNVKLDLATNHVSEVPGPLPLLGAGVSLGWSRRLRKRVKSQQS